MLRTHFNILRPGPRVTEPAVDWSSERRVLCGCVLSGGYGSCGAARLLISAVADRRAGANIHGGGAVCSRSAALSYCNVHFPPVPTAARGVPRQNKVSRRPWALYEEGRCVIAWAHRYLQPQSIFEQAWPAPISPRVGAIGVVEGLS